MFTSEPSLAQRIERMIGDTPIVDPYSRMPAYQPAAPDLAALMSDPAIRSGLIGVGMPTDDLNPDLPPDERVRRSIPYLKRMRNTSTAWCLYRIFRDLYDFDEPHLNEANYQELFDKVLASGKDPAWAKSVLQDRSKITTVITSLGNRSTDPAHNADYFDYRLDTYYLFSPGVNTEREPTFFDCRTRDEYYPTLESVLGERPTTTKQLERLLFDWLDRTVTGRVRYTNTFLSIERRIFGDEAHAQFVLNQASDDWDISEAEANWLSNYVSWIILKWHHENKKPIRIAVGAQPSFLEGKSIPRFQETWAAETAWLFHRFSDARFDLMIASDLLSHDFALLASQFPNVYLSGDWSHNFVPMLIEKNIGLRVQVAPMTKITGFVSDATSAEWTYGKLQIVRKAMAAALARLVDARFFEEDEIPPLLHQILHDTPRDLYGVRD
jgi:glucuronate isomerase